MRVIAVVTLSIGVFASVGQGAFARPAAPQRILYVGDWSGSDEVYSVDPARPASVAQITFGQPRDCDPLKDASPSCGISNVSPSPDGRRIAYVVSRPYPAYCVGVLYVADADGRAAQTLGTVDPCGTGVAWSPDSRRLAYEGPHQAGPAAAVYVVDPDRPGRRLVAGVTSSRFSWSPDGRYVATESGYARMDGTTGGRTYDRLFAFAWAPNGKWLAIVTDAGELALVSVATGAQQSLTATHDATSLSWSSDSRFVAAEGYGADALSVFDLSTGTSRALTNSRRGAYGWMGRGADLLAFDSDKGLSVFDARAGTTDAVSADHPASLAWSPDGRSIAYVALSPYRWEGAALRTATVDGRVRTVVAGSGFAGGNLRLVAWTRSPSGAHFRKAAPRVAATVSSQTSLVARWPIDLLATDGAQVAYASCDHVFVWTPETKNVTQIEPAATLIPFCSSNYFFMTGDFHRVYDLAIAGDRVAFGTEHRDAPYGTQPSRMNVLRLGWNLWEASVTAPGDLQSVDKDSSSNFCRTGQPGLGDLVGSGDLLAFGRWLFTGDPTHCSQGTPTIATETVLRIDPAGCPCAAVATSPGLLRPADVEGGRIVAFGSNETLLFDSAGKQLLAVPVSPLAAQLAGNDLVLALQGELRDYDATTGALLHNWPIPNVTTGGECRGSNEYARDIGCGGRLVLEDASRGLVAYVLDGNVHILRLSDGTDTTVAAGTLARFMEAGLVYASGASLNLVPWTGLPLP